MQLESDFQPSHTPLDISKYTKSYEINRSNIIKGLIHSGHGARAIDIGCGLGYFSKLLSDKGWRTTSIDTDSENITSARKHATEAILGDAITVLSTLPDNQHGLVLALEIIEHMPIIQGNNLLKNIIRVLEPNGKLIISTPNRYSPEGLGGYYWGEKIRRWKKWDAWDLTHVHIYSSVEILRLIKMAGFVVNKVIGYYYQSSLPIIRYIKLPLTESRIFPLNRIGFNIIITCHKR